MPGKKKGNIKKKQLEGSKSRELELKESMEEYAKVVSLLGDRKITVKLDNGTELLGCIPGKMKRKCWIAVDDVVIVGIREYQEAKVDILHKYNDDEVKKLIQYGEIPEIFGKSASSMDDNIPDDGIDFQENVEEINFDDI